MIYPPKCYKHTASENTSTASSERITLLIWYYVRSYALQIVVARFIGRIGAGMPLSPPLTPLSPPRKQGGKQAEGGALTLQLRKSYMLYCNPLLMQIILFFYKLTSPFREFST